MGCRKERKEGMNENRAENMRLENYTFPFQSDPVARKKKRTTHGGDMKGKGVCGLSFSSSGWSFIFRRASAFLVLLVFLVAVGVVTGGFWTLFLVDMFPSVFAILLRFMLIVNF